MSDGATRILAELRQLPPTQVVEPGVTAADALEVMSTPAVPAGCRYVPDQVFGTAGEGGRELRLHLYAASDRTQRRPGVVFVHGGGFVEGFPEMLIRYAARLAERGYVTAAIEYRLAGEACWPAPLEDVKCAVRWLRSHATEIGLDSDRIGVAGGSAGGHLAAMLASTAGQFEGAGGSASTSSHVSAAVLWYPATDLRPSRIPPGKQEPLVQATQSLFGRARVTDEEAAVASPVTYAVAAVPTLTMTGTEDPIVAVEQVREYHAALAAAGVANRLVEVPAVGHSYDYSLLRWAESFSALCQWFDEHLSGPASPELYPEPER